MFESIMVTLCKDSPRSPIIQQAVWLAKRADARLVGLYVIEDEELFPPSGTEGIDAESWRELVEPELRAVGQAVLAELVDHCQQVDLPCDTRVVVGPAQKVVCEEARGTDLVLMGRCGDYAKRPMLVGCSLLEGTVRRATPPVLVAAERPRPINRVLIAYDGGPYADGALATAVGLAQAWELPLSLITVLETRVGREVLAKGESLLKAYGLLEKAILGEGKPAREILRVCEEEAVDLLVMGAYCHNRVQELLFGGTVCQVLQNADCPVLICH
ncbi:MAG: universal stress protein [Chloroflexota bacterium]